MEICWVCARGNMSAYMLGWRRKETACSLEH